ncbi:MAG: hypothetical protein N2444_10015, partial [Methylocystis sp.]|nr:hypothetical protein [Methylocystis sp.]
MQSIVARRRHSNARRPKKQARNMIVVEAESLECGLTGFLSKLRNFSRLIVAVLLQDMRTRFGANPLSYFVQVAWPLFHMAFLTAAYYLRTIVAPVGDSPALFIATGVAPYILCFYPGRLLAVTIAQNRQLLNIPVIKPIHLILSRSILETLTAIVVLAIFLFALYLADVDIMPLDPIEAAKAIGAAIFLGVGLGVANVVACAVIGQYFVVFYILLMVGLYLFSGVYAVSYTHL